MTMNDRTTPDAYFNHWTDTWMNGLKHRFGLVWAIRGLIGAPVGLLAGASTAVAAGLRVPQGIVTAWRDIYRERRIGPNIKIALCLTVPVAVPIVACALSTAGMLAGTARGFWQGPIHGTIAALTDSYQGFRWLGEFARNVWNETEAPRLKEGEEVFDIKPLLGVWSGVVGVASSAVLGAAHGFIYAWEFPRLVYKTYKRLWGGRTGFVAFFFDVASVTVVPVGLVLGLPAFITWGAAWGLGRGTHTTYKMGTRKVPGHLRDAYLKSLRGWQKYLGKELDQDIDEQVNVIRP